jgi:hypothetical protein
MMQLIFFGQHKSQTPGKLGVVATPQRLAARQSS